MSDSENIRPKGDSLATVQDALAKHGLILRGGFYPQSGDGAPRGTRTLLLVGNAGPAMWQAFKAANPGGRDPLNCWTRKLLSEIADRFEARVIYPFEGPPYAPFVAWATRAEAVHPSPLGILIHPKYGLWHAWRGALAFPDLLNLPETNTSTAPCVDCTDRPCLTSCPVGAFADEGYDVAGCAAHLHTPQGEDCLAEGCRARRACPIGLDYRYEPAQAALHMAAFLRDRPPIR